MALTQFGKALKKIRIDTNLTLAALAKELGLSVSFLSYVENGKCKIPKNFLTKIEDLLKEKGYDFSSVNFRVLSTLSNESICLNDLSIRHQLILASLANENLTSEQLDQFEKLLGIVGENKITT